MKLNQRKGLSFWSNGALLLASTLAVAACGSPLGAGGDDDTNQPGGDGDGDGGGDGDGDSDRPGDLAILCETSGAGSPVLRRLTVREFEASFNSVFPELAGKWSSSLGADPVSHFGFDNEAKALVVGNQMAAGIDTTAASIASAVESELELLLPCAAATPDLSCAGSFLDGFGRRLFRRPLSEDEKAQYLGFFEEALRKTDFSSAMGWLTRALINAPETIYRSEVGVLEGETRVLTQHEIAAELSYTFSGTAPSDELLGLAEAGELQGETLRAQAGTLLASPGGREKVRRFFEAFLSYAQVTTITKTNVPEFEGLREEMKSETERFIEQVIVNEGGGLRELLTSTKTYPSAELATFYGMTPPAADGEVVERPSGNGIGVLAQGSVLSSEAGPNASSPTQRGLLVMEKFLCGETPDVPPDVPEIQEPQQGVTTTRQRYEELHAAGACASCHKAFDPIGFGFEHFDEVGRYRADEGGLPIDASGVIPETDSSFEGQESLAMSLAELEQAAACVSGQLKLYSFGVPRSCLGESRRAEFMAGSIGFVEYLESLATEPHFTTRRDE